MRNVIIILVHWIQRSVLTYAKSKMGVPFVEIIITRCLVGAHNYISQRVNLYGVSRQIGKFVLFCLTLGSYIFLGYNVIPDMPVEATTTTDLEIKGQSDTGLDWKTLALIGGVVIGITCVGLAGYYLYHHPEIIPTVFRPWRWFSPKTDPKPDAPKDEQNQDQDQDTSTTTTDESAQNATSTSTVTPEEATS